DFDVIDRVTALYEAVWSGAECRGCKLRAVCPDPIIPAPARRGEMRSSRGAVQLGKARRLKRHTSESRRR
ncbi:phospholipase, partial [Corallococcus sp. AB038B]